MSEDLSFASLMRRVREGDETAAAQLVRTYEPAIRRAIKIQMRDHRLRREVDTMDIGQSVLANFFVRASLGQFDLNQPEDLLKLLATRARKAQVVRREYQTFGTDSAVDQFLPNSEASPSQQVANRDLLDAVRQRLSDEERWLAEQRGAGREWADIAGECGGSAEALRKKLTRALDRVAKELGLDGLSDE